MHDERALAEICVKKLDCNNDEKISQEEFVQGLMSDYCLRQFTSQFN